MLKCMEHLGDVGSSRYVVIYSDGDGDFRPKFKTEIEYKTVDPVKDTMENILFDAG